LEIRRDKRVYRALVVEITAEPIERPQPAPAFDPSNTAQSFRPRPCDKGRTRMGHWPKVKLS
jgi:hypothetical protein